MLVILNPAAFSARTAESRPGPGPLTLTSRFLTPQSIAILLAFSAATCAAKGVLLRDPLKPAPPEVAQDNALPWRSVIVTIVLLKEACICAIPSETFFFYLLTHSRNCFNHEIKIPIYNLFIGLNLDNHLARIAFRGPFRVLALVLVR